MRALIAAMSLRSPPNGVHVVGTNGKGTVTTMLDAGLRAAGARGGRFVSPHVEDFRERIAVDGLPVPRETVRRFVARVKDRVLVPEPAFFELTLALALWAFARRGVGWGVFEAGVGGAHDATRALDGIRLVVITNVTLDHLETLGTDLTSIARDKAGALRPGVPLVTGAEGEALAVVRAEAERLGCPLYVDDGRAPLFQLPPTAPGLVGDLPPGGAYARNARLAAAALRLLGASEASVSAGLAAPALPARHERFHVGGREVVLDGAHDPAAAALLAASLPAGYVLVFGALARKQGPATLAALEPRAARVVLTEAAVGERPLPDPAGRRFVPDPVTALRLALAEAPPGATVVVAGSLYLAGRVRPALRRMAAAPRTAARTSVPA
ncbi:MAG TPA: Mur ligase family protein [Trueperaceae bacterium]|nr:Mur ligase family protein [Trueperaceae bacterium]